MAFNPTVILALLFLAGTTLVLSRRISEQIGIPWSREIHADEGGALPDIPLMVDDALGLVGRPDYLLHRGAHIIPVEVKPLRRAKRPYASDIYQLMAYCLLVEHTYGQRPPYGLLRYATHTFRIDYDDDMATEVRAIVMQMHDAHDSITIDRNHQSITRCRGCGFWQQCDQSLVLVEDDTHAPTNSYQST